MLTQTAARGIGRTGGRLVATSAHYNDAAKSVDLQKTAANGAKVPPPKSSSLMSSFKVGTGGRSSYTGNVVTIFGASGSIGHHVINRLAKNGTQIVIPYRCDPYWIRQLRVSGDLGQILFFPFELCDEESIRKAVKYSNVVINLIGTINETKRFSYSDVHVDGARRLARISREMGVERFIQMSNVGASHNPPAYYIPGGSRILRSRAAGEDAVREEFPSSTIIRSASMFGVNDTFISTYVNLLRIYFGKISHELHEGGENTYKAPVYKSDVASGISRVVNDRSWDGQTLEFVGPHCLRMSEVVRYIQMLTNDPAIKIRRGYGPATHAFCAVNEYMGWYAAKKPLLNWEMIETMEAVSDRLTGVPTLADVIGAKNLHHFEWAGRHWPVEHTYGYSDRMHFDDEKRGNKLQKINHYPFLYANKFGDMNEQDQRLDLNALPI
jgi:NADH dehydrogenase (ubiquinone) 1 alpha subcomplex subunit 9